jgi:hypothetical protein
MCSLFFIYVFFRLFVNIMWIVIDLCVLSGDWFIPPQLTGPKLNRLKGQIVKIVIYCESPRFVHLVRQLPSVIGLPEGSIFNNKSTMLRGPMLHGYWNGMKPASHWPWLHYATPHGCQYPGLDNEGAAVTVHATVMWQCYATSVNQSYVVVGFSKAEFSSLSLQP